MLTKFEISDKAAANQAGETVLGITLIPLWLTVLVFGAICLMAMAITATAFYLPWPVRISIMLVQIVIVLCWLVNLRRLRFPSHLPA